MNILIVNNGKKSPNELKRALNGHNIRVSRPESIGRLENANYDCIFLNGGYGLGFFKEEGRFSDEIKLLKKSKLPIFGICFGFELICYAYGSEILKLPEKIMEIKKIEINRKDPIFEGLKYIKAFEYHQMSVKKNENLVILSNAKNGIKIVKHPTKLMYGVAFHPELRTNETNAMKLVDNFIKMVEDKK